MSDWLPPALRGQPFAVARARDEGVADWRLRDRRLQVPTRGVRTAVPLDGLEQRARAFLAALPPDVVLSHVTAARLWGLSLPGALERQDVLHVMRATGRSRIRRAGCIGHRGLELREVARTRQLPVTGLADTWVDLGEVLGRGVTLDDLVVVGDEVATRMAGPPEPGSDRPDWSRGGRVLEATLASRVRPRGKASLSRAVALVRAPVRSPMETRARLMFVRAGFPDPAVNVAVLGRDGQWILEGDFVWERERVAGEYQGRDHGSIRQRSYDEARRAVAADEGWTVIEIYAEDVYRPARRTACLHRFARALGVDQGRLDIR